MRDFYEQEVSALDRTPRKAKGGPFWRQSEPRLDLKTRAMKKGGMWDHQKKWWDLENFVKVLVGGYGSGKTNVGCKRIIGLALQNAPCPVAAISPTYGIARQTTVLTIMELLQGKAGLLGNKLTWTYNASSHEFQIGYHGRKAKILIYSGDNPLSLRGPNLAAAYIDEPFIQELEVFNQMVARVRHPMAAKSEIVLTGTPEELNWGYDLCVGELSEKHDVAFVQASTRGNQALDPSYIERLEGAFDGKAAAAYIEGHFINLAAGLVYYGFDPRENVIELDVPEGAELGCGMDFNVDPMAACVFWRKADHIHFMEDIELPNSDTQEMCGYLRDSYGNRLRDVYPDASGKQRRANAPGGKTDFHWIREAGFEINAPSENPARRDRYNSTNGKFKSKLGRISLTISPKCKRLIKYLQTYSHKRMNTEDGKAKSHLLDAFSYPVSYLFPVAKDTISVHRLRGY